MWRLWMNQSCFSLGFLFQNSRWKLSTFRGYKGLYIVVSVWNAKSQFFPNRAGRRLGLATGLSHDFQPRGNGLASLGILSCSVTASVTFTSPVCFSHACSWRLPVASHSRVLAAKLYNFAQSWAFLHIFSHTTLTRIPPKYRVTNY